MNLQDIPKIKHTNSNNFFLLAGPCAIEGEDMAMRIAEKVLVLQTNLKFLMFLKAVLKKPIEVVLIVLLELEMRKR